MSHITNYVFTQTTGAYIEAFNLDLVMNKMNIRGKGYGYGHGVGDTNGLCFSQVIYGLAQTLHVRHQQFRDQNDLNDTFKPSRATLNIRRKDGLGLVSMLSSPASILITSHDALLGNMEELVEAKAR